MASNSEHHGGVQAVKIYGNDLLLVMQGLVKIHSEFEFAYNAIYMKRREDEPLWPYNYETDIEKVKSILSMCCKNKSLNVTIEVVDIEEEVSSSLTFDEIKERNRLLIEKSHETGDNNNEALQV